MAESKPEFDTLEVVPGFEHEQLQGKVWETATTEELREGLEKAFDYRGDVTLTLKNGRSIDGYIFDRRTGSTLEDSSVRLLPKDSADKLTVRYSEIAGLAFTGRDPAAGKSWEAWMKKYWEKKRAGEKNIELKPEKLD
ncbi:MAG TPA: hypothetical protein VG345_11660 [Bryobacteraceae bacterium]|nr:hypothetical protein [Bryobacteraceae bacterium]